MTQPSLRQKISDRTALVGVVGLGYVGLPLAARAAEAGYHVRGIDKYLGPDRLAAARGPRIETSDDFAAVGECDVVLICVPTPLAAGQLPDMSYIEEATSDIASNLRAGKTTLVVLESTTYPGTTREVVLPLLEGEGLRLGEDFLLAFAPERVDPGARAEAYEAIPRVVGGLDDLSGEVAEAFYSTLIDSVHRVSGPEVAEMSKLLENIFRAVNIALVNEMSLLCRRMGIDIWQVVEAAATKPFGFMSFKPGPGMGGHCIPVDPFYLAWRAKQYDFYPEFIELAGKINRNMPFQVAEWVAEALNERDMSLRKSRVLVIGVAYKEDIADIRESPALKIIEILAGRGAEVSYHDPYVDSVEVAGRTYSSVGLEEGLADCDCVLIATAHSGVDFDRVASSGAALVDTRNVAGRDL